MSWCGSALLCVLLSISACGGLVGSDNSVPTTSSGGSPNGVADGGHSGSTSAFTTSVNGGATGGTTSIANGLGAAPAE
jgi:hypothetical protein